MQHIFIPLNTRKQSVRLVVVLALAALTLAVVGGRPAGAQTLFLYPGGANGNNYTATDATYQYGNIYVGADSGYGISDSSGTPYAASLSVKTGGVVNNVFGFNSTTTSISGGSVSNAYVLGSSLFNITGGTVANLSGGASGTTNISGGTVTQATGDNSSTTNVSGGMLTNGVELINPAATVNFVGSGLTYTFSGYGNTNPYNNYADKFTVSGFFAGAGALTSYQLYVQNPNGTASTPANSAPRQFTFNGAAPNAAVVPEAASLALLVLPVAAVLGLGIARRRK